MHKEDDDFARVKEGQLVAYVHVEQAQVTFYVVAKEEHVKHYDYVSVIGLEHEKFIGQVVINVFIRRAAWTFAGPVRVGAYTG